MFLVGLFNFTMNRERSDGGERPRPWFPRISCNRLSSDQATPGFHCFAVAKVALTYLDQISTCLSVNKLVY